MRLFVRMVVAGVMAVVATATAESQRPRRPLRPMRPLVAQPNVGTARAQRLRQRIASLTPAQRQQLKANRQARRARIAAMTPAQREALKAQRAAARTERQSVIQRVQKGSITREQARAELRAWRQAHRPVKPGGTL